jgi:hypothetical protein
VVITEKIRYYVHSRFKSINETLSERTMTTLVANPLQTMQMFFTAKKDVDGRVTVAQIFNRPGREEASKIFAANGLSSVTNQANLIKGKLLFQRPNKPGQTEVLKQMVPSRMDPHLRLLTAAYCLQPKKPSVHLEVKSLLPQC